MGSEGLAPPLLISVPGGGSVVLFTLWQFQPCESHVASQIPYVNDYITKLCRTRADVILTHLNPNVRGTGQGEAWPREYKRHKLGGGQAYDRPAD
jgi:hypothetical protein